MAETITGWIQRTAPPTGLVLFAHGFGGAGVDTWKEFPALLETDPDLADFDVCFWGYDTSLDPNLLKKFFWSDNPDIDTLGRGLRTVVDNLERRYKRIVLVAHSMGGLVVQLFLLHEIQQKRSEHLDRIPEVILYGTPSAGLVKANLAQLLHTQVADMGSYSTLITDLRYQWKRLVDDVRAVSPPPFRLTLVAGMQDKFVPQSTSLDPFPFDEKEIVPGNHTAMVKPASRTDLAYVLLKKRLLRGTATAAERRAATGESAEAVQRVNRISAAAELGDIDDLVDHATELLAAPPRWPLVERALGLALLDYELYSQSVALLDRYIQFQLPGEVARPFAADAQALQQLAIARSGAGDIVGSVASLQALDPQLRSDPETIGILAGRFKRQWLKTGSNLQVARRALDLYRSALNIAGERGDSGQVVYNGVNAAYLEFATDDPQYRQTAEATLDVAKSQTVDYWAAATIAECLLLLGRHAEAETAYRAARAREHAPRHWTSTGQQALDIIERQGRPPEAEPVRRLFTDVKRDFARA